MSKDWEEKFRPEDLQRIRGFRLMDDDFMSKCFEENIECTELVLQIVLGRDDLKVEKVAIQHQLKNLQGRSIIFDIYATDHAGKRYNVEIQRADRGAGAKRARYHSSLIDANVTEPGEKLENLVETYVIFITEKDVLRGGLPIYHINRIIEETGKPFGDDAHIIYVNSQIKDETALGKLMHDFTCTDPDDMNYPVLAQRVRYFKEDTKGVATMCRAFEEVREESAREAKHEQAIESAKTMLADGLPYETIARYAKLPIEEVKALDTKKPA